MSKDKKQENIEIKIGDAGINIAQKDIYNFMDSESPD